MRTINHLKCYTFIESNAMRQIFVVGGCAKIPACKTILNESDFKMLLGQFAVQYSQLGNVDLTLDAMKTYMIYVKYLKSILKTQIIYYREM